MLYCTHAFSEQLYLQQDCGERFLIFLNTLHKHTVQPFIIDLVATEGIWIVETIHLPHTVVELLRNVLICPTAVVS